MSLNLSFLQLVNTISGRKFEVPESSWCLIFLSKMTVMTTIRVELLNQTEGYGHQAISQSQSSIKSISHNHILLEFKKT